MPLDSAQLAQLQRDYEILNLPRTASAQQIKQAYRRLARRWHPDLYQTGSPQHIEATQMMGIINQAYQRIATASLRYYDPRFQPPPVAEAAREPYVDVPHPAVPPEFLWRQRSEPPRKLHWFEFWVRFFFGALFGLLAGFYTITRYYSSSFENWKTALAVVAAEMIVFGVLSGIYGDDFWLGAFHRRWWWW